MNGILNAKCVFLKSFLYGFSFHFSLLDSDCMSECIFCTALYTITMYIFIGQMAIALSIEAIPLVENTSSNFTPFALIARQHSMWITYLSSEKKGFPHPIRKINITAQASWRKANTINQTRDGTAFCAHKSRRLTW